MMKLRIYEMGEVREIEHRSHAFGALVLEVVAKNGETVQLYIRDSGDGGEAVSVTLRGWGNTPLRVGNAAALSLRSDLAYEEPTCDEHGNRLKDRALDEALEEVP